MFEAERVFSQHNVKSGALEWFITAREGIFGPFKDQSTAKAALEAYKQDCVKNGADGGRDLGKKNYQPVP